MRAYQQTRYGKGSIEVTSRYKRTPLIQDGADMYYYLREPLDTSPQPDDIYYEVKEFDTVETIAHMLWNDVSLWWVICEYAGMHNPFDPLLKGTVLRLPSYRHLFMDLLR